MATLSGKKPTAKASVSSRSTRSTRTTSVKATSASEKIDHVFPDGTKFSGTFEQLQTVASALGLKLKLTGVSFVPKGYYPSESKGLTKIAEMNDHHIRRALIKRSKDYFTEIYSKEDTNTNFLSKFTALTDDAVIVDLYNELAKR
jgi:hypothetical protein